MDQQNQNQTTGATAPEENETHTTAVAPAAEDASFDRLMARSPMMAPVNGWLKCLRKPAISLQYSFQKRHIPDLDASQKGEQGGGTAARSDRADRADRAERAERAERAVRGQNSDVMDVTGGFTIRYFDLVAGAMGLMLLGCLWKGCCCLKRVMK